MSKQLNITKHSTSFSRTEYRDDITTGFTFTGYEEILT